MNDVKVWWLKKKYADFLSPRTVFALTFQTVKTDGKKSAAIRLFQPINKFPSIFSRKNNNQMKRVQQSKWQLTGIVDKCLQHVLQSRKLDYTIRIHL